MHSAVPETDGDHPQNTESAGNTEVTFTRRRGLQIAVSGLVAGLTTNTVGASTSDSSIAFAEPPAAGNDRVVVSASPGAGITNKDLRVRVFGDAGKEITSSPGTPSAEERTTLSLSLERSLEMDEHVFVALLPTGYYDRSGAKTEAYATADRYAEDIDIFDGIETTLVEPDPDAGFNYPYFLYAPSVLEPDTDGPVLVEPANTGTTSDDLTVHKEAGQTIISNRSDIADRLNVPFVVPVFPRPETDPVDMIHYTHALDDTTLALDGTPLERIDEQVLRMVEDAQERLMEQEYPVKTGENDLILNGFSASGNFVDRFTLLHPDRVNSVTAGGLNGMPLLPMEEVDGETLPFHVGIADVAELTGEPVDLEAVNDVDQFLFMGADDDNDTIPFDDAWTDDELRQTALSVYGEDMIDERFVRSQKLYREAGVDAAFRVYEDVGHGTPTDVQADIVAFHRRSIDGESVDEFGQILVPDPAISISPSEPVVDEEVELDAGATDSGRATVVAREWSFDDGETAAGETTTRTFDMAGNHVVQLTITTDTSDQYTTERALVVSEDGDSGSEGDGEGEDGEDDGSESPSDEEDDEASEGSESDSKSDEVDNGAESPSDEGDDESESTPDEADGGNGDDESDSQSSSADEGHNSGSSPGSSSNPEPSTETPAPAETETPTETPTEIPTPSRTKTPTETAIPTETAMPTETPTETATTAESSSNASANGDGTQTPSSGSDELDVDTPGFGLPAAVTSILGVVWAVKHGMDREQNGEAERRE